MKRRHPSSLNATVATALAACAIVGGCRNQSGGMANPFLAPNRVPPPSTRMIAPGTAQPYYPGDPLPVMQSSAQPPAAAVAGAAGGPQWTSPLAPTNAAAPLSSSAPPAPSPPVAFSNEPSVGIPSDSEELRFALPSPQPPPEPAPITPVTDATPLPTTVAGADAANPNAAAPPNSGAIPAAYNQPATGTAAVAATDAAGVAVTTSSNAPWRSPQPAQQPIQSQPYYGMPGQPILPAGAPPSSTEVQLRAVPSAPVESIDATTPRIRMPGYPASSGASGTAMQAVQTVPVQSPWDGAVVQPYGAQVPGGAAVNAALQPQPSTLSPDGFRPRSTMR